MTQRDISVDKLKLALLMILLAIDVAIIVRMPA